MAFAEAINAWTPVEEKLAILIGLLAGIDDINRAVALVYAVENFRSRVAIAKALASESLEEATARRVLTVLQRTEKAASKRNRIVHGAWGETLRQRTDLPSHRIMYRDAARSLFGSVVTSWREAQSLKGNSRFYLDDLLQARREFRNISRDLLLLTQDAFQPAVSRARS